MNERENKNLELIFSTVSEYYKNGDNEHSFIIHILKAVGDFMIDISIFENHKITFHTYIELKKDPSSIIKKIKSL